MKTLFDTNVVLDLLLARPPFVTTASALFSNVEQGKISGYLCATTITTVYYLLAKGLSNQQARVHLNSLLHLFEIADVTRPVIESALQLNFSDFEDAVLHEAARYATMDAIVTRNTADFATATLPIYTPDEFLERYFASR